MLQNGNKGSYRMLICPQCQFPNPNTNKFCQGCGTSLTYKVCAECGTSVALNQKQCPNCGAKTGKVWWAIVSGATEGARDWGLGTRNVGTSGAGTGTRDEIGETSSQSSSPQPLTSSPSYLDSQQRYQLLEPLVFTAETDVTFEAQVRVLDTQPFQLSLLKAGADLMMEQAIPADAKIYTALQPKLSQQLPAIHDAWQQGSQQVLLIADRSHWRELMELWLENTTTPLQILHWFDDMVQLWE